MILQLDTENADRDLTALVTVLTHTPSMTEPIWCKGLVMFGDGTKNLSATGGDFELTVTVGGNTIQPDPQTIAFSTAVRAGVWTTEFPVPANAEVVLRAKSPNAADSDVDVTAYLYQVDKVDVLAIGGDKQSATDIKHFADSGYDPATGKVEGVKLTDTTTTNTDMVAAAPTAAQNRAEMDSNSTKLATIADDGAALATVCTEQRLAELDQANLPADISAVSGKVDALQIGTWQNYYNDSTYDTVGYDLVTGTLISGTADDTKTQGTQLVLAPDGTNVLDVNFRFPLSASRPSELTVRARYDGSGGTAASRYASVYFWNFALETPAWVLITDAGNRIAQNAALATYAYIVTDDFKDPITGEVRVRYVSSRVTAADRLYLDVHLIIGAVSGATAGDIASAVWTYNIKARALDGAHVTAGWYLSRMTTDIGVVTAVAGVEVTMSGDRFSDTVGLYNNRRVQFHKNGEDVYEVRRIVGQAAGGVLTLDRAPILVESSGWHGYILHEMDTSLAGVSTFDHTTDVVLADITKVAGVDIVNIEDFKADVSGLATELNLDAVGLAVLEVIADTENLQSRLPVGLNDGRMVVDVGAVAGTPVATIDEFKADVSGIPEAVDLELSTNHGSGSWASSGGGVGVNTVTITITDGTLPLPNVSVAVRNSDDSATICSGFTDVNGRFPCSLDDGDYLVRLQKNWYNFTTQTLTVVGDTSATYEGTAANPVDPGSGKQTIYGYIKDVTGVHVANATVAVRGLSTIPVSGGNLVSPLCESVVSGSDGSFSINVLKGIDIEMRFIEEDETFYSINLTVTADGTKEITTYLTA